MNHTNLLKWADWLERNEGNQVTRYFERDGRCCLVGSLFRACDEELGPVSKWDYTDRFTRAYHWVDMWGNKDEYASFRKKAVELLTQEGQYGTHGLPEILVNLNDDELITFTEFAEFIREWVRQRETI